MASRGMPPSTSVSNHPAAAAATSDAARNYMRLKEWIERECAECDAAIAEHRKQIDDYRSQKGRMEELQKKISHPIMVPFGSVGFMPGKLVRTNEVLVLLGANHFAECSVHDTAKIIDRRIREINAIVDKLEHQKRNARERLNFAQGLFGGATAAGGAGKDEPVEIREEYDERKEAEARRKRAERAAAARAEKKVPQATFENMMSRLDELEKQEKGETRKAMVEELDSDDELPEEEQKAETRKAKMVQVLDSDEEIPEEEEEYVDEPVRAPEPPKGVNPEEYKRLLARLDQLDADESSDEDEEASDDAIEEVGEEMDSDDCSDTEEERRRKFEALRRQMEAKEQAMMREREEAEKRAVVHPRRPLIEVIDDKPTVTPPTVTAAPSAAVPQSITEQIIPKMTVVSENDRVVDLVEYQNQQEEDDKAKENSPSRKLTHKRSVRFKKNLEAGPCEKSIDSDDILLSTLDAQVNPRSILRNKSEESPIDKNAFSEMEDQRSTTILPAGDAFSGCVVERQQVVSAELPIVFKPVDEPPRRVSRFKLQRMQQATE
ncbi:hypothetical protein PFISCL1PPCAC_17827 [Pristionchus fissidentatus]|uniref:Uri-1 n=1 Tax=Pristionchus fissidentatus TaxID=1538716 RepID=A0AAV5W7C2_9BILA|nr:hypothetical protein PFISCL1PPCAC_17827 [Pristionchus fissidentatus]